VTVFDKNENIDEKGYGKVIEYLVEHGVDGIFTCGGQGEGYSLSASEKLRCLEICLETVNGRVPVLAGAGGITTRSAIEMTESVKKAGADAAVIITPYFISPNQNELFAHYKAILETVISSTAPFLTSRRCPF